MSRRHDIISHVAIPEALIDASLTSSLVHPRALTTDEILFVSGGPESEVREGVISVASNLMPEGTVTTGAG